MEICNSLLAVAGTGTLRPGTVRGPAAALAAFCAASRVAKSAAGLRWPDASCASAGTDSATVRTIGMRPESETTFIVFPPSAYTWPELLGVRPPAAIEVTSTVQRAPAALGGSARQHPRRFGSSRPPQRNLARGRAMLLQVICNH